MRVNRLNKKAQFYVLAAILLSTFLFASLTGNARVTDVDESFDSIITNFVTESPHVINHAKFAGLDVSENYNDYVNDFIYYAETKNIRFGVMYLLAGVPSEDKIELVNYIGTDIIVDVHGVPYPLENDGNITINRTNSVSVIYSGTEYQYTLEEKGIDFKALFRNI